MKCLCPDCCALPAPTYTEEFRRECEARWVLQHPKEWRQAYYADIARIRGKTASLILISDVKWEYEHARKSHDAQAQS